jgi:hypothetical protein
MTEVNLMGLRYAGNTAVAMIFVIAIVALMLFLGPYLLALALTYVFSLLNLWGIMSQVIAVTYWQAFWLMLASLVIRFALGFDLKGKS